MIAALAALGIAFGLPPRTDWVEATADLCTGAAELATAVVLPVDEPLPGASRNGLAQHLHLQLHQVGTLLRGSDAVAPALQAAQAHWPEVIAVLLDASATRTSTLSIVVRQARLFEALARQARLEADRREQWRSIGVAVSAAGALIAAIASGWTGRRLRRQRRHLSHQLRRVSDDLHSGEWQQAVRALRSDRQGPPSAFDALATGVESALGESDRRWQALADQAADWYWETDARHRIVWMSGTAAPIAALGWSAQRLLGMRHDAVPIFEAPAEGWAAFHARLDARSAFRDTELRLQVPQGQAPIWVSLSGRPRQDSDGRFAGYEGIGRDVTERRLAHERLRASEQRWSLMAGLASDYYWETDAEHRMLPLRPEVSRRIGPIAERIEGRTRWEAHPDAMGAAQWTEHRADLDARRPFRSLLMHVDVGDGRLLWLSVSGIPRFDAQGRFLGYHGVGKDVTLRREAERLLMRHNEALQRAVTDRTRELEQVNLDLDAFARQLAHELRTPIGHVQGLAHLLESRAAGRLSDDDRQLIELQTQAARHMRETVDALLLLARSTVQPMPMQVVDVSALAHEVIAELPPLRRTGHLAWVVQDGVRAVASPAALRIVLANLLGNAAKFTRRVAAPTVRFGALDAAAGSDRLTLFVEDNGAGFDMEHADRLFKPFNRLHSGEDFQGTGIGLTIVQRIVERHGGAVTATARPGQGARFEFTLRAAPALAPAAEPAPEAQAALRP